jgi:single-stranded-DNA-specific exonuclease
MPGVNLGKAVIAAVEDGILARGGGHAMAAGITVEPGQLPKFRAYVAEALASEVAEARKLNQLRIDAALSARGATTAFVHEIEQAGPFGSGNPTPIFAFPGHKVRYPQVVGKGGHIRFSLQSGDGARLKAIAFRTAGTPLGDLLLGASDTSLHLAGTLGIDHWQGREEVQLRLVDAAQPDA